MAGSKPWRVDVHHHFYPPEYLKELVNPSTGGEGSAFPGVRDWTVARTVEEMDRHGAATAIISLSPPGCRMLDVEGNRRLARICNDFGAQMARDNPGRFGLFGVLPLPDVDGSLREIAYAFDTLKADGIELMTSYGDKWLGDPAFEPIYQELNRRSALVFVHPLAPTCCAGLIPWVPPALVEYPHDTNRCIMSLMFSGTLSSYPDIRFIFCHGGGSMPMLAGRVQHSGSNRRFLSKVPKGIDYELKKLHYDIALAAFRPSLSALFALVPVTQVLLGSDYPFSSIGDSVAGLDDMRLSEPDSRAIYRGNAERLIPRLKALVEA
jgi:predicted TIM-barrel fold metal-dependent hydrolase